MVEYTIAGTLYRTREGAVAALARLGLPEDRGRLAP